MARHMSRVRRSALLDADAGALVVADDAVEGLAFEQLHHHEDVAAIAVEVVHGDDVRVRQVLRLAAFALERLQRFGVAAGTRRSAA